MENYSYSSYPDSGDSASPRSREIDCDNPASWDEPQHHPQQQQQHHHQAAAPNGNSRVKFMCSYGGKIQPRAHDNQLSYVAGDTKILAVDRAIRYPSFFARLASLSASPDICLKYQLPGEDLDALISVTNDEDLEHMMLEYDRLHRTTAKAARLRLFLFPVGAPPNAAAHDTKSDNRHWFVDALNSVPIQSSPLDSSSQPESANPDFLFGLDKGFVPPPAVRVKDPELPSPESPTVTDAFPVDAGSAGSELSKEERRTGGEDGAEEESLAPSADIPKQILDLQRLQIASQEQAAFQQRMSNEETAARAFPGDYYLPPQVQEKAPPSQAQMPPAYWQDRHIAASGVYASMAGGEHPVYLVTGPPGVYPGSTVRPVAGQAYYAVKRMVSESYREPALYGVGLPPQPTKVAGSYAEGAAVTRPQQGSSAGFSATPAQVAYDGAGRAVYYTSTAGGTAGMVVPTYQTVTSGGGGRSSGGSGVESGG